MAILIDGKAISLEIRKNVKDEVDKLKLSTGEVPGLAVILAGDNPASAVYVRMKKNACAEAGIRSFIHEFPASFSENELLKTIDALNNSAEVNGILVQLPLPRHISENRVIESINPSKDADGLHPVNAGKMLMGEEDCFLPCTPHGCQELISRYCGNLRGKHLVVVGRSNIVGKPIASMMYQKNSRADCTVTICHTSTPDMSFYTRQADILVVAAGRPRMITADMVKEGAIVIDVGINRVPDPAGGGKTILVGDVDFESVQAKASAITPVPGGVGPMTIAMLLSNTLRAFKKQKGLL